MRKLRVLSIIMVVIIFLFTQCNDAKTATPVLAKNFNGFESQTKWGRAPAYS